MPAKEERSSVLPRVHFISDSLHPTRHAVDLIAEVVAEGIEAIQIRDKTLNDRELFAFAQAVVERLRNTSAKVIVNDRLDIALAVHADGVHLGSEDLPVAEARRLSPAGFLIGGTCRDAAQAKQARADGADYVGVGPVFTSTTKTGLPEPIGLDVLALTAGVLPVIAIAGISVARVPSVMTTGVHGVAVVAAISRAPDPRLAARQIVDAVLAA